MVGIPAGESTVLIDGPAGTIEIAAMAPKTGEVSDLAIICHPHSQMGGSLQNKVVHTLARAHRDAGHLAIRFNFRSVGKSKGVFDDGVGESDDLAAVVSWARGVCPQGRLYLAGFSFGAYVLARSLATLSASGVAIHHATLVAPPQRFGFDALTTFPCPLTVIMGEEDEVVDPEEVYRWFDSVTTEKRLVKVPAAGHFFHGLLGELKGIAENDIK